MAKPKSASGPLHAARVVELGALGPTPFAAMMLADAGADVIRVVRPGGAPRRDPSEPRYDLLKRNRPAIEVDLKNPEGVELVLRLAERADIFLEGFRPGVAERLGVGPHMCLARNEKLVYGRMSGYGQDGPMADKAGHDINFVALSGALWSIGRVGESPVPPLNLLGDFGGGGMLLAFGVLAALVEARQSGEGQVVDAAMVDGTAVLDTMLYGRIAAGSWMEERGTNVFDTGAPFYEVYETSDGKYMAVGAGEPQFYSALLAGLGLDSTKLPTQRDRASWPEVKAVIARAFATRTRDAWVAHFAPLDACVTPVLSPTEAPDHPHNRHRGTFVDVDGVLQPAPAPRFSRTPSAMREDSDVSEEAAASLLERWGVPSATGIDRSAIEDAV